jgi:HSP20 family molecular chaperone IbpA
MTTAHTRSEVRLYPPHGKVTSLPDEYVVELEVPEFRRSELNIVAVDDVIRVVGDHGGDGSALALSERLEESFRVPHDGRVDEMHVEFGEGKVELHIPRRHFVVNPDSTPS